MKEVLIEKLKCLVEELCDDNQITPEELFNYLKVREKFYPQEFGNSKIK